MKSLILLTSLSVLSFGCSKTKTQFKVNQELLPLYNEFVYEGQIRGQNVSTDNLIMEFGNAKSKGSKTLAYCGMEISSTQVWLENQEFYTPKIIVDRKSFDGLSDIDRRTLLFHEMGHCLLHRDHDAELNEYQYVKSIMYPYLITQILGEFYGNVEKYYIDELFDPNAPTVDPAYAYVPNHNSNKATLPSNQKFKEYTISEEGCDHSEVTVDQIKALQNQAQ